MQCNSFTIGNVSGKGNGKDIFHIGTEFGGIPSTLLTNFVLWLLILALFLLARKSLFVLFTHNLEHSWTRIFRLFYGQSDEVELEGEAQNGNQSLSPQSSTGSHLNRSLEGDILLDIRRQELTKQRPREDEIDGIVDTNWIVLFI